jgi:protein SCO1/2
MASAVRADAIRIEVPDVSLIDQDGRAVRFDALLQTHDVVIVSFFFTRCSATCPAQTAVLRAARRALTSRDDVLMLSISLTPDVDRPAQLRSYAAQFNIATGTSNWWVFLTGEREDVARVTSAFAVGPGRATDHPNVIWVGDSKHNAWRMTSASNPPDAVVALAREHSR